MLCSFRYFRSRSRISPACRGRNHVAAATIAQHRLTGAKGGGHAQERDGRGAFEHTESARAFGGGVRGLHIEPEHPGIRKPQFVFAVDQR
jgi:hypothetical protein